MRYWDPSGHLGLITNRYTATSPVIKDLHYVHFPSLSFLKFSIFTTLSWKWPPAFFATFKTQGIMHQIMFIHPTNSNMVSDIFLPLWRGNCFFFLQNMHTLVRPIVRCPIIFLESLDNHVRDFNGWNTCFESVFLWEKNAFQHFATQFHPSAFTLTVS